MSDDIRTRLSEALDQAEAEARGFSTRTWTAVTDGQYGPAVRTGADKDAEWSREVNYPVWRCDDEADGCPDSARQWIAEAEHIARWDPSTVLRLIERDRDELRYASEILRAFHDREGGMWPDVSRRERSHADSTIDRLAAFWVGTPEVDR